MYILFQCVAEAVAEQGVRGLAEFVPGGGAMFDIAQSAWKKYRDRCLHDSQCAEIQQLAQANFDTARQAAVEAAKKAAAGQPDVLPILELYLSQIPASIRQTLKRAEDPTGLTVPANYTLRGPEDLARLLPPGLPQFRPGSLLPGRPGWVLEKPLGIGGFGEVWLARQKGIQSLVGAVKFCRDLQESDRTLLWESKIIERLHEAMKKNPDLRGSIVPLLDAYLEGETPWLMYEYMEGGDLTDLIHEWSALPTRERQHRAMAALQTLARGIAHFHRLNPAIVHRDLKPANILRDDQGRLRITDFGISGIAARHTLENETRGVTTTAGRLHSSLCGSFTPLYASPQQKAGALPDPRDDVHALGVIAFQMLTGGVDQPLGADFAQDLSELGVSKGFIGVIGQCIAARAERRPRSAGELADALAQLPPEPKNFAPANPQPPRLEPAKKRSAGPSRAKSESRGTYWLPVLACCLTLPCCGVPLFYVGVLVASGRWPENTPERVETPPPAAPIKGEIGAIPVMENVNAVIAQADFNGKQGGADEPGWAGRWAPLSPQVSFQTQVVFEGDAALHLSNTGLTRSLITPLRNRFIVQQQVQVPPGGGVIGYVRNGEEARREGPIWNVLGGKFSAYQGDGQGGGSFVETPFAVEAGKWHKVSLLIDISTQSWEFFVDDRKFEPPQPLKFRSNEEQLRTLRYQCENAPGIYIDAVRILRAPVP
jgi:serine/threonine protein kinase